MKELTAQGWDFRDGERERETEERDREGRHRPRVWSDRQARGRTLGAPLARGLAQAHAHSFDILHMDVKSHNYLVKDGIVRSA